MARCVENGTEIITSSECEFEPTDIDDDSDDDSGVSSVHDHFGICGLVLFTAVYSHLK